MRLAENVEILMTSESSVGDIKFLPDGRPLVYGPDPWAWNVSFNCWFSLDVYHKETGEIPKYVSDANRKALGDRY